MDVEFKWAEEFELEALARFVGLVDLDWSKAANHWLIVKDIDGRLIGALQVEPGHPTGFLCFLTTDAKLGHRLEHDLAKSLIAGALEVLKIAGVKHAMLVAPLGKKWVKRMAKKDFGGKVLETGNFIRVED